MLEKVHKVEAADDSDLDKKESVSQSDSVTMIFKYFFALRVVTVRMPHGVSWLFIIVSLLLQYASHVK